MYENKVISLLFFSFFLLLATTTSAQEQQVHEIGLRMGGLNSFGFIYKKQTDENRYRRYRIGSFSAQYDRSNTSLNTPEEDELADREVDLSFGFGMGFEKRRRITDKLVFIHGWAPQISTRFLEINREVNDENRPELSRFDASFSIGYILGFQMPLSDHFQVSIETIPSLGFTYIRSKRKNESTINYYNTDLGFNANFVSLSVMYRFSTD